MEPSLGRHKVLKVIRWALFLSGFNYRIEHVPGDINIWPEIMTRWMRDYRKAPAIRLVTSCLPFSGVTIPQNSPEFGWPSPSEIKKAQGEHKDTAPQSSTTDKSGVILFNGAAWIPNDCVDLKLRLITIAHAGSAGNRGADSTLNYI